MRAILILGFIAGAFSACEVGPNCLVYPTGCDGSEKICCTQGWSTVCSCCISSTTPSPLIVSTTEHASSIEPTTDTVSTAITEPSPHLTTEKTGATVTAFGSTTSVMTTGNTWTIITPVFSTTIITPTEQSAFFQAWLLITMTVLIPSVILLALVILVLKNHTLRLMIGNYLRVVFRNCVEPKRRLSTSSLNSDTELFSQSIRPERSISYGTQPPSMIELSSDSPSVLTGSSNVAQLNRNDAVMTSCETAF